MATDYKWTGTFVHGSTSCAIVRYRGPTMAKDEIYRAAVPYSDGPIAAALAAAARAGCPHWKAGSAHIIDADTYCVGFKAA